MATRLNRRTPDHRAGECFWFAIMSFTLAMFFGMLLMDGAWRISVVFAVSTIALSVMYLRSEAVAGNVSFRRVVVMLLICLSVVLIGGQLVSLARPGWS